MIASFKYIDKPTFVHRLDPRTKIIITLVTAFTAAMIRDLRVLAAVLALALVYYLLARIPWREVRAAWTFIFFFIFILVGLNTLLLGSGSNEPNDVVLVQFPFGIALSWANLIETLGIVCRMLAGALTALPLTFTIPPTRFGVAFRGLGASDRIAFAIDLAIRLVPTYGDDFRTTINAQRARGFEMDRLRGGLFDRVRRLAPLVVPVTMNAIVSGEDITNALDMRGFGLRPRTWLHKRRFAPRDYALLTLVIVGFVAAVVYRFTSGGALWVPSYSFR